VTDILPISVVVPTIGRPQLLRSLFDSLARCDPRASEVVVVDQSHGDEVASVVRDFAGLDTRLVRCSGRGEGLARNVGLREAHHDVVLWTDDDCTVAPDWVGRASAHMTKDPGGIVTGRVLPGSDPLSTPSFKDDPVPHDYTGDVYCFALFPNNMAVNRWLALALGGFDEWLPSAPDNDFCYRWVRAGNRLRYAPDMLVWHHDWRTPDELERLYVEYARGQGAVYAKHLRRGDLGMLRPATRDLYSGLRGLAARVVRGRPPWSDARQGVLRGLPVGLLQGWRAYGPGHDTVPGRLRRTPPPPTRERDTKTDTASDG
jgi:GT2 family glycosyltransferase